MELFRKLLSYKISSNSVESVLDEGDWTLEASSETTVSYKKMYKNDMFEVHVEIMVSLEGYIGMDFYINPLKAMDLRFDLDCFLNDKYAKYMMGLDQDGGVYRPYDFYFNSYHQDSLWIGSPKMGLAMKFKDDHYTMPFSNVYYKNRPLNKSLWDKITITPDFQVKAQTREFHVNPQEGKSISVEINLTPFKCLDMIKHFNHRYYQPKENSDIKGCMDDLIEKRCHLLNIHHGQDVYPYINYPFNHKKSLSKVIDVYHQKDIKVKLYYTMRELSHHIDELRAFLSLDYEIFPKNEFIGDSFWDLRNKRLKSDDGLDIGYHEGYVNKEFDKNLIPAWEHRFKNGDLCAGILTETHSRLNNYYMEGLKWMLDELDIDGIYIDDTFLDRKSMIRLKRIAQSKDGFDIDLHSWNHRHEFAGQVSSMMLYMQLLPFVDRLWIGESYDYNKGPDYWLTEISGIPFGLTSDMLEGDGHVYRGMLYGMTNRTKWGESDPLPIYKLWDDFGIEDSKMIGYWEEEAIKLQHKDLKLTCYYRGSRVLMVFASWAQVDVSIDLNDLKVKFQRVYRPYIDGLQDYQEIDKMMIEVASNQGVFLIGDL